MPPLTVCSCPPSQFVRDQGIPLDLTLRLRAYFRNTLYLIRSRRYEHLLSKMSLRLRGDASFVVAARAFRRVGYLSHPDLEPEFLTNLTIRFRLSVYCRLERVPLRHLFVIDRGVCAKNGKISLVGSTLGEDMIICNEKLRDIADAIALTFVQNIFITREAIFELLPGFPNAYRVIRRAAYKIALRRVVVMAAQMAQSQAPVDGIEHAHDASTEKSRPAQLMRQKTRMQVIRGTLAQAPGAADDAVAGAGASSADSESACGCGRGDESVLAQRAGSMALRSFGKAVVNNHRAVKGLNDKGTVEGAISALQDHLQSVAETPNAQKCKMDFADLDHNVLSAPFMASVVGRAQQAAGRAHSPSASSSNLDGGAPKDGSNVASQQLVVEAALRPLRTGFEELRTRVQQQSKDISGQVDGVHTRLDELQQQMSAMMDAIHTMSRTRVAARSRKNVTQPPRAGATAIGGETGVQSIGLASTMIGTGTGACTGDCGGSGPLTRGCTASASAVGATSSTENDRQELRELQSQEKASRSSPFEA